MSESEKIFIKILAELPNGFEGKMFGAKSIKSKNGKTAAFLWKDNMTFKLDDQSELEALKIVGAKIGTHLYAKDRQMKGWVLIPKEHCEMWNTFSQKALEYVENLNKTKANNLFKT